MSAALVVTAAGTLASRVLGMLRDMALVSLWGLTGGGLLDAFVTAFRIPNLFRSLFGEGALAANYVPEFSRAWLGSQRKAWQLACVTAVWLSLVLAALVVIGEGALLALWLAWGQNAQAAMLLKLSAALLPYVLLVCLAAQLSATLQALSRFTLAAVSPILLNICWLGGIWLAPGLAGNQQSQAWLVAGAILIAGVLQVAVQWQWLRSLGWRWDYDFAACKNEFLTLVRGMAPMLLALAATRLSTVLDSLIAWGLARTPGGPREISWLGGLPYPLEQGAAAAVYCGERLYQLPLGLVGVATASVVFPLLARVAAQGRRDLVSSELTRALRLVAFLSLPASAGLILLAQPVARLLFEYGQFTAADTARAATMIAAYGCGVWAYCLVPVLFRGYYALGDRMTPLLVSLGAVALNALLNLALIWPLRESGLALATALASGVQVVALAGIFQRRHVRLDMRSLAACGGKTLMATGVLALVCQGVALAVGGADGPPDDSMSQRLLAAAAPAMAGLAAYVAMATWLRCEELRWLLRLGRANPATSAAGQRSNAEAT